MDKERFRQLMADLEARAGALQYTLEAFGLSMKILVKELCPELGGEVDSRISDLDKDLQGFLNDIQKISKSKEGTANNES